MNANIARKHFFMKLSISLKVTFMLWRGCMICITFRPSDLITILTLRSYGHLSFFFFYFAVLNNIICYKYALYLISL